MSDSELLIMNEPEGYRIPIHQSLTLHHLMLGIPRSLCIVIWTFCVALSFPLRTWYAIPLALFLHAFSTSSQWPRPDAILNSGTYSGVLSITRFSTESSDGHHPGPDLCSLHGSCG